jgi:hypothetical protein
MCLADNDRKDPMKISDLIARMGAGEDIEKLKEETTQYFRRVVGKVMRGIPLSDDEREFVHEAHTLRHMYGEFVADARKKRDDGEELSIREELLISDLGDMFPEKPKPPKPPKDPVDILVDCPHCQVSRVWEVERCEDAILTCSSCGEKFRIRKEKFDA